LRRLSRHFNSSCLWFALDVSLSTSAASPARFSDSFEAQPTNLNFGVVNSDVGFANNTLNIGASIEHALMKDSVLSLQKFDTVEGARSQVEVGNMWGYLDIPVDFTVGVVEFSGGGGVKTLNDNPLTVALDYSNYQVCTII
jgi:hypothetical protein